MSDSPTLIPVTTPVLFTTAIEGFEDCQVAWLVTSCVVPVDMVARADSCAVAPIRGAVPDKMTETTVGAAGAAGVAGPLPPLQAHKPTAHTPATSAETIPRYMAMLTPY